MSRSAYVKYLDSTTEIKEELEDTKNEIKIRCSRALETLHKCLGEQVKQPVPNDDRIHVSWLDD